MKTRNNESFKDKLRETGLLIKNSFTIVGKDKDIKKPTIKIIILSLIITILSFGILFVFLLNMKKISFGTLPTELLVFIVAVLILTVFRYFYNMRQKANQSWIVYKTITGGDISYKDACKHTKKRQKSIMILSLVDMLMDGFNRQKDQRIGLRALIVNIFLSASTEIWDLVNHYMIPAIIIDNQKLEEMIRKIKSLENNVPATLTGVFGVDFVGDVLGRLFYRFYFFLFVASLLAGYFFPSTFGFVVQIGEFSFSWIPIFFILFLITIFNGLLKRIVESIKVIYFTIFYTQISKPEKITGDMREELIRYLKINKPSD